MTDENETKPESNSESDAKLAPDSKENSNDADHAEGANNNQKSKKEKYLTPIITFLKNKYAQLTPFMITVSGVCLFTLILFLWLIITSENTRDQRDDKIPHLTIAIQDEIERQSIPSDFKEKMADDLTSESPDLVSFGQYDEKLTLIETPQQEVIEESDFGLLPKISDDGLLPYKVYARPSDLPESIPKISILMTEIGINTETTQLLIDKLPGKISFVFSAYTKDLDQWGHLARLSGHEFFIETPFESTKFPREDTGPYGLLSQLDNKENLKRLKWQMTRATGYVGFVNLNRSRITALLTSIEPIIKEISKRGILYADPLLTERSAIPTLIKKYNLPFLPIHNKIDMIPSANYIDASLKELELKALKEGHVVASASPYPLTIDKILEWLPTLEAKGIALVPASSYYIGSAEKKNGTE